MFDCHMHCSHSVDSPTPIDDMVEACISKGMKYIAFTDHFDRDYIYSNSVKKNIGQINLPYHIADTLRAKDKYKDKIEIACGIECGYCKEASAEYPALLKGLPFDIVLNSVHMSGGLDCYESEYFAGKSKKEAFAGYLVTVLDSVRSEYDYDVITHLGYVCRKAPYEERSAEYDEFADIYDSILKEIISRGVSLELNSHNRGTATPFLPFLSVVHRYIELGGSEFTFGSDAHRIDRVNDKFEVVKDFLLSCNQKYINIFRNREKIKIDLTKV